MGMTKEEQRAAAERILAKQPMTEEEKVVARMLKSRPEEYEPPISEYRKCGLCGQEFRTEEKGLTAMQQFSDHGGFHNASPAQYAEAHKRIQAGKEREKQGRE